MDSSTPLLASVSTVYHSPWRLAVSRCHRQVTSVYQGDPFRLILATNPPPAQQLAAQADRGGRVRWSSDQQISVRLNRDRIVSLEDGQSRQNSNTLPGFDVSRRNSVRLSQCVCGSIELGRTGSGKELSSRLSTAPCYRVRFRIESMWEWRAFVASVYGSFVEHRWGQGRWVAATVQAQTLRGELTAPHASAQYKRGK